MSGSKMNNHNCEENLEYDYTIDKVLPFGEIVSIAVFKCIKCGKEFLEGEMKGEKNVKETF